MRNGRNGLDIIILGKRGVARFIQVYVLPISVVYLRAPDLDYQATTSSKQYNYCSPLDYCTSTSSMRYCYCSPPDYRTTTSSTRYHYCSPRLPYYY
jgi:hypothetical protein